MSSFSYSTGQPEHWNKLCDESGALFGTAAWQALLQHSFRCHTIYACNEVAGFTLSVFRAGPFKIGYLGFPVGAVVGSISSEPTLVDSLRSARLRYMPICIRIPVSAFNQQAQLDLPFQATPETVIENLPEWNLGSVSKNLRRDVRKADRSGLVISEANDTHVGAKLFDIYFRTVKRHGGALRYNAEYFHELIKLAKIQPRLRVLIATRDSDIAGFMVTARHGDTAYYLHGGSNPVYRKNSPSDLLLNSAIHNAQRDGSQSFSLMASPPNQPSLIRYKEKWGGATRDLKTYTLALRHSYQLFKIAEKIYSLIR